MRKRPLSWWKGREKGLVMGAFPTWLLMYTWRGVLVSSSDSSLIWLPSLTSRVLFPRMLARAPVISFSTLSKGGNDGIVVSLDALGGGLSVGLDMRESLDGVVELDPEGSLEAGGGGGADGFEGTNVVSAESVNSDGTDLVESPLDVGGPARADRSLQVGHGDGGDVLSHLGVSSGHAGQGEQQKSGTHLDCDVSVLKCAR